MNLSFQGPAGKLEGILWEPEGNVEPVAVAVVCHPHPAHLGTMKNNVVHRTARGLHSAGLAVLRFNFRSVGQSEGEHDGQGAEDGDLVAALDEIQRRYPGAPIWAGGFSFGSRTAARVALEDARIKRVFLVALPVIAYDCSFANEISQPGLAIMAEQDEYGTLAVLTEQLPKLATHFEVQEIAGEGHFFRGALDDLRERITTWAQTSIQEQA